MDLETRRQNLRSAVEAKGGFAGVARALENQTGDRCYRQLVYDWVQVGRVPPKWVIPMSRVTGLTPHEIDPWLYPSNLYRDETHQPEASEPSGESNDVKSGSATNG